MKTINTPGDIFPLILPIYKDMEQEMLTVITLNGARAIIGIYPMSIGTDCACLVSPKLVARRAVLDLATGVIMLHNHPSNDVTPSNQDVKSTENVRSALELFDIQLLDHIILGEDNYFSFMNNAKFKFNI